VVGGIGSRFHVDFYVDPAAAANIINNFKAELQGSVPSRTGRQTYPVARLGIRYRTSGGRNGRPMPTPLGIEISINWC
jgi:hypothetical protein